MSFKLSRLELYFSTAVHAALESKYDGSKVGAVLVKDDHIVAVGWNGYPAGADDGAINKMDRSDRLDLAIHAEVNAILNAAKHGNSAEGATMFVTHKPCTHCLSKLQNAGVKEVRYIRNRGLEAVWCDSKSHIYEQIPLHQNCIPHSLLYRPAHVREIYEKMDKYYDPTLEIDE